MKTYTEEQIKMMGDSELLDIFLHKLLLADDERKVMAQ